MEYSGPPQFVHLHCHTVYSTLDGVQTPEQLFEACAERKWPALAVTEHGVLSSIPDNYFAAKAKGIKYIPGCEIYYNDYEPVRRNLIENGGKVSELKQSDPDLYTKIMRNRHLTVLAKNQTGLNNLIKMCTEAWKFGYYYRPRIWFDKLVEYREGLIVLSGCLNGPVSHAVRAGDAKSAENYILKFREAFKDDYYMEVQMPCLPPETGKGKTDREVFAWLHAFARKYGIPPVLTNDAHYLNQEDFEIQKLMMAIDQDLTVDSPDLFHVNSNEQYLKTRAQLYETFKTQGYDKYVKDTQFEEACNNTLRVEQSCEHYKPNLDAKIPTTDGDMERLRVLAAKELIRKGLHKVEKKYMVDNREVTYKDQMNIELKRFEEKGFASYFMITQDLIQFSLKNGWPVGPRGSVGGSLVCYLLGITELDPLKWKLSFDRFLSPSRGGKMLNIKAK